MATIESLVRRSAIASERIERRAAGIARALDIKVPQARTVRYPDAEHRRADADERIAELLTVVLRKIDAKAPELKDPEHGVINEQVTTYEQKGDVTHVRQHQQPLGG